MLRRTRKVRIFVRNKQRYDPEKKVRDFLYVDVEDFVGTTIADIKEDVRKQTKSSLRIDELFLNNLPLADDRSVAHYNLQHETILETTSNPFWVACLYIKVAEVKQEQEGHPNNEDIQKWTQKSIPKKYTLIGLLLNSKKEKSKQPPHFPTLDDFVLYLEGLNKKGATMHPDYTQKDMRAFEREYKQEFEGRYSDPLAAFLDHHALRLGYLEPEDIDHSGGLLGTQPVNVNNGRQQQQQCNRKQGQERLCEDCEVNVAVLYCTDCPGGIALCEHCSQLLHAGVKRRRHNLQDIRQAPKTQKAYVPRAFLAPFAITVAMYRSLTDGRLSLTEEEIKKRAQPLTDTDLMDKQNGRYVGGFDCMENMLINKGLVKKEAARIPTYALTESGQILGEKLYTFYVTFNSFLQQHLFPKINSTFVNQVAGNRKICLVIDEHERDKDRLLAFAADKHIDAQVRFLPAGDYVWIISPPMYNINERYLGTDPSNELVLPFVVERKSWEDFENTLNTARYQRQINNMLGSGIKHSFYLMEGSLSALKSNPSQHHQKHLKAQLEKLTTEYGFYVNYTTSWMKSAQWLLWFSQLVIKGCTMGFLREDCISYSEYSSRVARQAGVSGPYRVFRNAEKVVHRWTSHLFIDHIFRDSQGERSMLDTVKQDLHVLDGKKHLLVIQDLEQYNKKRQSTLNKCCEMVYSDTQRAQEIVSDKIGISIHNMLHYDIPSFWQLYIQVMVGVYIVRTENEEDTNRMKQKFLAGPQGPVPKLSPSSKPGKTVRPNSKSARNNEGNQQTDIDTTLPDYENRLTFHAQSQGQNFDNSRKVSARKKSNIHTISSESSDTIVNRTWLDATDKHENQSETSVATRGIPLHMVKPFSGEGHCLGTKKDLDIRNNTSSQTLSAPKPKQIPGRVGVQGLLGGVNNTGHGEHQSTVPGLRKEDFVDPQEEDAILQEVITKSEQEDIPVKNEEELYRLAVEMSMQDHTRGQTVSNRGDVLLLQNEYLAGHTVSNRTDVTIPQHEYLAGPIVSNRRDVLIPQSEYRYLDEGNTVSDRNRLMVPDECGDRGLAVLNKDVSVPDDEDEQIKLALERSMTDSLCEQKHTLGLYQQEDLQLAIERSKQEVKVEKSKPENELFTSMKGVKRKLSNTNQSTVDTDSIQNFDDLSEDQQLNLALELSRQNSVVHADSDINTGPRSSTDESQAQRPSHTGGIYGKLDNLSEEEQMRIAIEKSKIENYSPRKRFKSGTTKQGGDRHGVDVDKTSNHSQPEVILIDSQSQDINNDSPECSDDDISVSDECVHNDCKGYSHTGLLQQNLCTSPTKVFKHLEETPAHELERDSHCDRRNSYNNKPSHSISSQAEPRKEDKVSNNEFIHSRQACNETVTNQGNSVLCRHYGKTGKTEGTKIYMNTVCEFESDEKNLPVMDSNVPDSEEEQVKQALERSLKENFPLKFKSDKDINDDDDDCADDDCVLPSPIKLSESRIQITPVIITTRTSSTPCRQLSTRKDIDKNPSITEKLKIEVESPNKSSLIKTYSKCSDRKSVKKGFDLKASLFYDSEASNEEDEEEELEVKHCECSGIEMKDKMFDTESKIKSEMDSEYKIKSEIHCEYKIKSEMDDSKSGSCVRIPGNVIRSSTYSKQTQEGTDKQHGHPVSLKYSKTTAQRLANKGGNEEGLRNIKSSNNANCIKNRDHRLYSKALDKEDFENTDDRGHNMHETEYENDDDLHDIDYQPDSQQYESESCESGESDIDTELDVDSQSLPVIGRPRMARYRKVKQDTTRLVKERHEKHFEKSLDNIGKVSLNKVKVKTETSEELKYTESVVKYEDNAITSDEQLARFMQNEFDSEVRQTYQNYSTVNDEQVAKELQEHLEREVVKSSKTVAEPNDTEDLDEAYAKQLDLVLNGEPTERDTLNNQPQSSNPDLYLLNDRDEEIEELQRQELEKIERWRKTILDDGKLARQLQQLEDMGRGSQDAARNEDTPQSSSTSPRDAPSVEDMSFKQMVAVHKASRERALVQLEEYRQMQMGRFQTFRSENRPARLPGNGYQPVNIVENTTVTKKDDGWLDDNNAPIPLKHKDFPKMYNRHVPDQSQQPTTGHVTNLNSVTDQSQQPSTSQVSDLNDYFNQSQVPSASHLTDINQSQSQIKNSNITCGNCGEKGHNRTFTSCKKYHTAEETARREAKLEKARHAKEEKKRMEIETLNLLTNHQQVLEEMTEQIQNEMNTIQRKLKLKTSELEKQVSNRVKKMENNKNKRRK